MKLFSSASFFLPIFLLASTVLSTHAFCEQCLNLRKCSADLDTLDEVWRCMGGGDVTQLPNGVETIEDLNELCCEKCPDYAAKFCEDRSNKPSGTPRPTGSNKPSGTPRPTGTPSTVFKAPSSSPSPTVDCTCCDCVRTCTIQPDPHYRTWDNSFYDFQGGCDQYAIKNDIIEVQIATRPRTSYSTITQVTVLMKQTGESFKISVNTPAVNTIVTGAVYSTVGTNVHMIDFNNVPSFIKITKWNSGLSLQVQGHGTIFSNSEGMCGSWNQGGVRRSDGTVYSTAGGWQGTALTSISLADSWKIPPPLNQLVVPALDLSNNPICDASSTCGTGQAFACNAVRKLQKDPVSGECDKTCSDIKDDAFAEACELDIVNTGDKSWACQPSYVKPVLEPSSPCDFEKPDDKKCKPRKDKKEGYICHRLGGTCVKKCKKKAPPGYVCLDLCIDKKYNALKKKCQCMVPLPCSKAEKKK